jgi:hypothetical protein
MPKLHEGIGGTKTKIYCQGTVFQRCILAVLWTIKLGLTKVGNQAKPLKYSEKVLFCTNLEHIFKHMATTLDTWLTMQQRLTFVQCACQLFLIPIEACLENHLF